MKNMYKRFYLFVFASIIGVLGYAQQMTGLDESMPLISPHDTIDYAKLCAHYKIWVVRDASAEKKKYRTHEMFLQMGEKVSKFSDYNQFVGDSAVVVEEKAGLSRVEIMANMMARMREKKRYDEQVFKNYPEGSYTIVDKVGIPTFLYKETEPEIEWTILAENTDTILGYVCGKATCTFRGRTYVAWYAPDIPIGDGPWKFHGLPGLILKVNDEAKDYYWTCTALYQPQWESPISIKKQVKKTTYEKYHKAKKRSVEDPYGNSDAKIKTPDGRIVSAKEFHRGKKYPPYTPKELEW